MAGAPNLRGARTTSAGVGRARRRSSWVRDYPRMGPWGPSVSLTGSVLAGVWRSKRL